jgi:hypothetical protein
MTIALATRRKVFFYDLSCKATYPTNYENPKKGVRITFMIKEKTIIYGVLL